jgi:hypothetical protein
MPETWPQRGLRPRFRHGPQATFPACGMFFVTSRGKAKSKHALCSAARVSCGVGGWLSWINWLQKKPAATEDDKWPANADSYCRSMFLFPQAQMICTAESFAFICHPFVYISRRKRERERERKPCEYKNHAPSTWRASTCSTHTFTYSHIYWFCCVFSLHVRYLLISHTMVFGMWSCYHLVDAQTQSSPCHQFHIP